MTRPAEASPIMPFIVRPTIKRRRRALTLVELVVAMAMTSAVLAGAVAAIGIAGRAFRAAGQGIQGASAYDAMGRITADLALALAFVEQSDHAVAFYVPDRTGDGGPELIRYAWEGNAGDPLTRSVNGSTPVAILQGVRRLHLGYLASAVTGQRDFADASAPPADALLFDRAFTDSGLTYAVTSSNAVAAIVRPMPGNNYAITRVRIPLVGSPGGDAVTVGLHRVNMTTGTPDGPALGSATLGQSSLPTSMAMVEFAFASPVAFEEGDFVAVVVSQGSGLAAGQVALESSTQYLIDGWIATRSGAGSWSINATRDMPIEIMGVADDDD